MGSLRKSNESGENDASSAEHMGTRVRHRRCTERRAPGTDGGRVISLVLQPVIGVMALSRRYKVMASARAVIWPVRRRLG